MMCFAPECKHYSEKHMCKFFTFPKNVKERKRWIKLIRRADRDPNDGSRICSCHFKDGVKQNGPTLFLHNVKKRLVFHSPPKGNNETNVTTEIEEETVLVSVPSTSSSVLAEAENMLLQKEVVQLTSQLNHLEMSFSFKHIEDKDDLVVLYTGLPNKKIFLSVFNLLKNIDKNYYLGWNVTCVSDIDQLFLTLLKLRQNPPHKDLALRFNCSSATVTNIFVTWLHLLHEIICCTLMKSVPSRHKNEACLPNCFSVFPNARMVIDCTEIYSEIPHSLKNKKDTYSHYKHRNTLKGLVGVAPNGVITYISPLYPGSTSDKKVVQHSGILNIFEPGDLILADKGFLITDILPAGVSLNIPPFLCQPQFTPHQIIQTRNIARARIHVERAIRRCKAYKILHLIPQNLMPLATKIWQVCGGLTNFQFPLIKEVETYYQDKSEDI
ncbi:hypothetical protein RI129_010609 [Pyrocoelia pectoralis]|uniref:THAP-type domain-containing protein n=1 Tax=Pyrocoelia pectoralis TaxID=417401 RepID=A0AAN7V686_9COLE